MDMKVTKKGTKKFNKAKKLSIIKEAKANGEGCCYMGGTSFCKESQLSSHPKQVLDGFRFLDGN